jgi:predicted MPP superfamily phosphohydrolase
MRLFRDDAGTDRIAEFLREANILLLADEAVRIWDTVYIAGRRDARPIGMRQSRISAAELAARAGGGTADSERVLVMLDHQPVEFPQIEAAGVDLLLCGHTHKGQIFPANLITRRVFSKAGATHYGYWQGKTMQAVVTSGAGVWGPPLRVGTNSETAVIDIRFSGN